MCSLLNGFVWKQEQWDFSCNLRQRWNIHIFCRMPFSQNVLFSILYCGKELKLLQQKLFSVYKHQLHFPRSDTNYKYQQQQTNCACESQLHPQKTHKGIRSKIGHLFRTGEAVCRKGWLLLLDTFSITSGGHVQYRYFTRDRIGSDLDPTRRRCARQGVCAKSITVSLLARAFTFILKSTIFISVCGRPNLPPRLSYVWSQTFLPHWYGGW